MYVCMSAAMLSTEKKVCNDIIFGFASAASYPYNYSLGRCFCFSLIVFYRLVEYLMDRKKKGKEHPYVSPIILGHGCCVVVVVSVMHLNVTQVLFAMARRGLPKARKKNCVIGDVYVKDL